MNNEQPAWDYKPSGSAAVAEKPAPGSAAAPPPFPPKANSSMSWTAAEFLEHQRGAGWYFLLCAATAAIAAIAYLISKDYFTIGIIAALGIAVAIAAKRQPQNIQYTLDTQGISVGTKSYNYGDFKSFAIIHEGTVSSVEFMPLKKFMLPVAAYINPADEERIMDVIGQHLPYEERQMAFVDRLSRRLRF